MGKGLFWVAAAAVLLAACDRGVTHRQRVQAPTGPGDLGVVAFKIESADAERVMKAYPRAKVRALNPTHGLFEFFEVTVADVRRVLPAAAITANRYLALKPKASRPGPEGAKLEGLDRCLAAEDLPTASLTVDGLLPKNGLLTIELGQSLRLSAAASEPHAKFPGKIKTAFVILPPGLSALKEQTAAVTETTLTPDAVGVYQVFVVAQDERAACAMDSLSVVVTANRPFSRPQPAAAINLSAFTHLERVSAPKAWELSEGSGRLIAVIDTGVNYNHPLLAANLELNAQDPAGDGVDGDGNGFVDDELGYDFVNADPWPYDDDGHGSHVAGLAAGVHMGLARKARILPIKALTSLGGDLASVAAAVFYAVDRGAHIVNMSIGAGVSHPLLEQAMMYAEGRGVMIVAAAGNGDAMSNLGYDIDRTPMFPASYPHGHIVTVGASDSINPLAPYSNFGASSVDVVAPGGLGQKDSIYSTAPENPAGATFIGLYGTSMATPIVSGIAAQIWSANPDLSAFDVRMILLRSGREIEVLKGATVSGRHLDARAAVELALTKPNVLF